MQTPELNCQSKQESVDDNHSDISEKCWKPEYKGDSRKWIIRDASYKLPKEEHCSEMKESYMYPIKDEYKNEGSRKAMLLKQFYEEAKEEINKETTPVPLEPEYCTEYDGEFKIPGFQPEDHFYTKNPELYQKFPLYSSEPISVYSFQQKNHPDEVLHGLTKPPNKINLFRKNANFSKPLDDCLDNIM